MKYLRSKQLGYLYYDGIKTMEAVGDLHNWQKVNYADIIYICNLPP